MKTTGSFASLAKLLNDEDKAIEMLESLRWPKGAACPHCGGADPYKLTPKATTKTRTQKGLWKCKACRRKFTVKVGTIFESSHIPVSKWLMAIHLLSASKKGMSAHQFHRMLGLTYRAAWFMAHRLRHAMNESGEFLLTGTVEVDETYIGARRKRGTKRGIPTKDSHKTPVVALVQRNGRAVAFPMERINQNTVGKALEKYAAHNISLMTDEASFYRSISETAGLRHQTVNHGRDEYVRGNVHTNTVEGFFSLLKRGINGTFHHVSKGHLHRYCDEFAFRHNRRSALGYTDGERAAELVLAAEGKRLTFKQPSSASAA